MHRVSFEDLVYFSIMNYFAASKASLSTLTSLYDLKSADKRLFTKLQKYCSIHQYITSPMVENPSVIGVIFFYNMFNRKQHYLPYDIEMHSHPNPGVDEMLIKVVQDAIDGKEGGYVHGVFLDNRYSPPVHPAPFTDITHRFQLPPHKLFSIFFPEDFNRFHKHLQIKIGSSRTSNSLGAALLGSAWKNHTARVLVLKETCYGKTGWGKIYQIKTKYRWTLLKNRLVEYLYDEVALLTSAELKLLNSRHPNIPIVKYNDNQKLYPGRDVYAVKRSYKLEIKPSFSESRLLLQSLKILDPQDIFEARKRRRKN